MGRVHKLPCQATGEPAKLGFRIRSKRLAMALKRDYTLLLQLQELDDETLVGAHEVATLLDLSPVTIRHHKVSWLPKPLLGYRRQRWRLGAVRAAIRQQFTHAAQEAGNESVGQM